MSDPKEIEQDLRAYLDKESNLTREDRMSYLKTIFHKHLDINNLDHLITQRDLFLIFGEASSEYANMRLPVRIGKKELDPHEGVKIALMEAFILYLSRMRLLRKIVKFDYKE